MAAKAYAVLVSLVNTMDEIQVHPFLSTCFKNFPFESLHEKVDFLVDFVHNHSHDIISEKGDLLVDADSNEAEDLLSRIAVAAQKAEDIIEVEAADRIHDGSTEINSSFFLDLQKITLDLDSIITEEVIQLKEAMARFQEEQPTLTSAMAPPLLPPSSAPTASARITMVGFDGYLNQLLDELNGSHSSRRILPIVGMGGVGKTTLARNAYDNPLIVEHFYVRVWITVSQTFTVSDIFLQALSCLGLVESSSGTTGDRELGEKMRRTLYGRRYLIVLDDAWSIEAWEKIKFYFPDNNNGSRIVVTTRQQEVVDYFASSALAIDLLDEVKSWELFCHEALLQGGCPPKFEEIGKKIAQNCKGLPLAITVIGGLLKKSPRTLEFWGKMARDKSLIHEDHSILSILYLSYKHLPVWLKPCFLYLGLFPEDHRIDASILIKYWVAEGFIKQNRNPQSLEEVAESYVKELVDRNLLSISNPRINKKLRGCHLHDLVRDLCIKIAEKEKFYAVERDIDGRCHFIVDQRAASFISRPSTQIFLDHQGETPFKSRLLRVFVDDTSIDLSFQRVNSSFFHRTCNTNSLPKKHNMPPYNLPPSISLRWTLQTLIFNFPGLVALPSEIWRMPQLRHIDIQSMCIIDPPRSDDDVIVLKNLQTLVVVRDLDFSDDICYRMPSIKELRIKYYLNGGSTSLQNVGCFFNKLEVLEYSCHGGLQSLKLPSSLKELTLQYCPLGRSDMAMIASLPHLQFLKFVGAVGVGTEWDFAEDEFVSLKHLRVQYWSELVDWIAESSNFPVLEALDLWGLPSLREIPYGIVEIATLERMHIYECSKSAKISAIKILEELENSGNESFQLQLQFITKKDADIFRGKIQESGFRSKNLQIFANDR